MSCQARELKIFQFPGSIYLTSASPQSIISSIPFLVSLPGRRLQSESRRRVSMSVLELW